MKRGRTLLAGAALCALVAMMHGPVRADFELTGPDGRRILLKDDNTWRYIDAAVAKPAPDAKPTGQAKSEAVAPPAKDPGEAVLHLTGRIEGNRICRFQLRMLNNLPYEIRSLVPVFSVFRTEGVVYDSVFQSFQFIKPGDSQAQEVRFDGLTCKEIVRVQVGGGDRCEMGELDKFSPVKGKCLSLVRVVPSDLVRFDK